MSKTIMSIFQKEIQHTYILLPKNGYHYIQKPALIRYMYYCIQKYAKCYVRNRGKRNIVKLMLLGTLEVNYPG